MKVSDFTTAVQQLWDFVFPPFLNLALAFLGLYFLLRGYPVIRANTKALRRRVRRRMKLASAAADLYGVTKLLPVAAVFVVLSVFYMVTVAFRYTGRLVPLRVSIVAAEQRLYHPNTIAYHRWQATEARKGIPYDSFYESTLAAALASKDTRWKRQQDAVKQWEENSGERFQRFEDVKPFVVLFTIGTFVAFVAGLRSIRLLFRWLALMGICTSMAAAFLVSYLYALDQRFLAANSLVTEFLLATQVPSMESLAKAKGFPPQPTHDHRGWWWSLEPGFSYQAHWFADDMRERFGR